LEVSVFFKNIETLTLKRDTILRKFRKQLRDYGKGKIDVEGVRETLKTLRKHRRALTRLLREFKGRSIDKPYNDHIKTLLEFTLLIAISEETELLSKLSIMLRKKGVNDRELIDEVNSDLEEVKELGRLTAEFLNGLK